MKRLQYYLSIAQLLHMLLLATGAAFIAELFDPRRDIMTFTISLIGLTIVAIALTHIYFKTARGTSKKRT